MRAVPRTLSQEEARAFYNRFGRKQDWQVFYEDRAVATLLENGNFSDAKTVVELGCGTGRVAERLLRDLLPGGATYVGLEISETMIELARARLGPWKERAVVLRWEGSGTLPVRDRGCDRFLSTYVLDLLPEEQIAATLREARRVLSPDGRLCLTSLTFGRTAPARLISRLWTTVSSLSPRLVGGCRPLHLQKFLRPEWTVIHHEVVCAFGICSEVVVAS